MKKIILSIVLLLVAVAAGAQGLHPRAVMETKYDGVGNSPQTIFNNMPATGVKCFRVLDGDKTNISFAGLDCYNMGPTFSYNSSTNQIDAVVPTQVNADWAANSGPQQVINKPNTLAGYGISDAMTASAVAAGFYPLTGNPAAYVNAAGARGAITVSGNGNYNSTTGVITVNAYTPAARIKSSVTKAVGVCFQVSATRDAQVSYNVQITASATVIGGAQGTLFLETFSDSACTLGVNEEMRSTSGNTNALAISLGNVLTQTLNVNGWVMAGQYAKLRTSNDVGAPIYAARIGWEVQQ